MEPPQEEANFVELKRWDRPAVPELPLTSDADLGNVIRNNEPLLLDIAPEASIMAIQKQAFELREKDRLEEERIREQERQEQERLRAEREEAERLRQEAINQPYDSYCGWLRFRRIYYLPMFLFYSAIACLTATTLFTGSRHEAAYVEKWLWHWRQRPISDLITTKDAECPEGYEPTGPNEYSVSITGETYHNQLWCDSRICVKRFAYANDYPGIWRGNSCPKGLLECAYGGCVPPNEPESCPITRILVRSGSASRTSFTCSDGSRHFAISRDWISSYTEPIFDLISTVNLRPRDGERPGQNYVYDVENQLPAGFYDKVELDELPADEFYDANNTPEPMRRARSPNANGKIRLYALRYYHSLVTCLSPKYLLDGTDQFDTTGGPVGITLIQAVSACVGLAAAIAGLCIVAWLCGIYINRKTEVVVWRLQDVLSITYFLFACFLWATCSDLYQYGSLIYIRECIPESTSFKKGANRLFNEVEYAIVATTFSTIFIMGKFFFRLRCCRHED